MSDPFQELMERMRAANDESKTAREHVKSASVSELEEPGDILASHIYNMTRELEARLDPKLAAEDDEDTNDEDGDEDDGDDSLAETYGVDAVGDDTHEYTPKEAAFTVPDLGDHPLVKMGFEAELREFEPVIQQAISRIVAMSSF